MATGRIRAMLDACITSSGNFPPTILYNESWLLRLVLDWFYTHKVPSYPLSFLDGAHWFSEAALPSQFLRSPEGARLAEGWSHADGVIGHFEIGKGHKIDLSLHSTGTQLVVLEAKMFSLLAPKTSNISYYDQAARSVACVAELLARAGRSPSELSHLGFYVLAPASQIDKAVFAREMSRDYIRSKVEMRVNEYAKAGDRAKNEWYINQFLPTLQEIDLRTLKWEDMIKEIEGRDSVFARSIKTFYDRCVTFSRRRSL